MREAMAVFTALLALGFASQASAAALTGDCPEGYVVKAGLNTGAAGTAGAMTPVTWLESAVFSYRDGQWRMEFLHSDRVRPPS